jgi:hypothetical protein
MSFLNPIITDLREKRLWPVALVLLAALVAVPVLLAGKSSSAGSPTPTPAPVTAPQMTALPAVSLKGEPAAAHLTGRGRDPFPGKTSKTTRAATGPSPTASPGGGGSAGSGSSGASSGSSGSSGGSSSGSSSSSGAGASTTSPTTTTSTPTPTPKPTPSGLTSTESYDVSLGITNVFGGVNRLDPVTRLGALPSLQQPLLVELGVAKGAHRVLFGVLPGTEVSGAGSCTPGPLDCQILSLGKDQTETLSVPSFTGSAERVADFAVTGISVAHHPSAAAASRARRATSAQGQQLLRRANLSALSLFRYEPSLGVIVDHRSLTVGAS